MNSQENEKDVMCPIRLVNYDICMKCPEMDIKVFTTEFFGGNIKFYENRLQCAHYERCLHLAKEFWDTHEKHGL